MAFVNQNPRQFVREAIEDLMSGQMGVYGIFRHDRWIYVGKGDIRSRLLAHLNGDNALILLQGPTHFVTELWSDPHMSSREKELILECLPMCNQKVG
jgi:hypothetical protein